MKLVDSILHIFYTYYNKKCAIWNQPISYYNKLSKDDRWKKEKKVLKIMR